MEAAVEQPVSRAGLARIAGTSLRSLERLFIKQHGQAINKTYMKIRLNQADQLVRKTNMTIINIALACGFRSSSHFARAFKGQFGVAPSSDRAAPGKRRSSPR
jgi:transcriptional regulator GlxA family with amidase domain